MTQKQAKSHEDTSIKLTKFSLIALFLSSLLLIFSGTWIVDLIIVHPSPLLEGDSRFLLLLLLGYVLGIMALVFIFHLYQLVNRIGKNQVFILQNVQSLRWLGWETGIVAGISLIIGLSAYLPMLMITVASSLSTLIIRVIRNAFGKAVELQEQVDYTI